MRQWHVSSSKYGFSLTVYTVSWWVLALERTQELLCWATGGILGGHPRWGWVQWVMGKVRLDEALYGLENAISQLEWKYERRSSLDRIPLTVEQASRLEPEFVADMERMHAEFAEDDSV